VPSSTLSLPCPGRLKPLGCSIRSTSGGMRDRRWRGGCEEPPEVMVNGHGGGARRRSLGCRASPTAVHGDHRTPAALDESSKDRRRRGDRVRPTVHPSHVAIARAGHGWFRVYSATSAKTALQCSPKPLNVRTVASSESEAETEPSPETVRAVGAVAAVVSKCSMSTFLKKGPGPPRAGPFGSTTTSKTSCETPRRANAKILWSSGCRTLRTPCAWMISPGSGCSTP
jgi:hypothetical protein